ncbi:MAG: T9SS type A sorting domain-containing protein [Candidatus Kapaibacterium sp.]
MNRFHSLPRIGISLLTILSALFLPALLRAQSPVSGLNYLIAFPDTVSNVVDVRFPNARTKTGFSIMMYSPTGPNRVVIDQYPATRTIVTIPAGKFVIHDLIISQVIVVSNTPQENTIRLTADQPIVVYCYFATAQSCEAWTPLPVEMWGTSYNLAGVDGGVVKDIGKAGLLNVPFTNSPAPAEALIIAAHDDTHVTIHARSNMFAGSPSMTLTLREHQAYQVQSLVDTNVFATSQISLAGISITSDKPIGVLSGNTRALVRQDEGGLANNIYKNMLMEWLSPRELQGKKSVYLPTWDDHRGGINAPAERVGEYVRVYGTSAPETFGYYFRPGGASNVNYDVPLDTMKEHFFGEVQAAYFETQSPAQVMMHSPAITKFNGTTPCAGDLCTSYSGWASYMVNMTPREQWAGFAPYYAPAYPVGMKHYINAVCDTNDQGNIFTDQGTLFPFTRKIPGTSLVWGSQSVTPGEEHYLIGRKGATFAGHVYGLIAGSEDYRIGPGSNTAEYEEYSALSYGYPLASRRAGLGVPDRFQIGIDSACECCSRYELTIRSAGADSVGISSIALDPATSVNTQLVLVDPALPADLPGRRSAVVRLMPIDPLKSARATVVIIDQAGGRRNVSYDNNGIQRLEPILPSVDFPALHAGDMFDTTLIYHNPTSVHVPIAEARLALGNQGFSIVRTSIALPGELRVGDSLAVTVRFNGIAPNRSFTDTLLLVLPCGPVRTIIQSRVNVLGVEKNAPGFALEAITPNPLTGKAEIRFSLGAAGATTLTVHDEAGRMVGTLIDGRREAGFGSIAWDATAMPSGIYYFRLTSGGRSSTRQVIVRH